MIPNPYADPPREEAPGETAQRVGGYLVAGANWLRMHPTDNEKEALCVVAGMLLRWLRREGKRKIRHG